MDKFILANKLFYRGKLSQQDESKLYILVDDEFIPIYTYLKDMKVYALPRYFNDWYKKAVDKTTPGININIKLKKNFKPQNEEQEKAIQAILNNDHGVVAAHVGFGKTFVAVAAMSKLKKKTLIIVHKLVLLDQWRQKLVEYTNLKDDDIGIIQGNKVELDKPVVVASIATIVSKSKSDPNFMQSMHDANFGITFYDECHITTGAVTFNESTQFVFSKRLYGLSATPYRSDHNDKMIYYFLGNSIYSDLDITLPLYVVMVNVPVDVSRSYKYIMWGGKFNKQRYISLLCKNRVYIEALAQIIRKLNLFKRHILILSDRIKMLELIQEQIKDLDTALIYGSRKREFNKPIILATTGLFREGVDIPHLDTLLFATPLTAKVGLTQSIGRVARVTNHKKYILVIDICNDRFEVAKMMAYRRQQTYKSLNAIVIKSKGTIDADLTKIEGDLNGTKDKFVIWGN